LNASGLTAAPGRASAQPVGNARVIQCRTTVCTVSFHASPPYCTYEGGLNAELFVILLRKMMRHRAKPVHLVVDGLPAHKTALVRACVASTELLTLHFLPGYAPELNPDELVWSHVKRTGVARAPLRRGEKLRDKIEAQLAAIKRMPRLVRSFFQAPTVAYITDW
jgi:transposase